MTRILFAAVVSMIALPAAAHDTTQLAEGTRVTLVYEHLLPDVPGKSLKGVLVEYAPGAENPPHTHAPSALIYATVLEGTVKTQVNGGTVLTLGVGENFTELPGSFHNISANASTTDPARLLAVFVVNSDEDPLTIPAPAQ